MYWVKRNSVPNIAKNVMVMAPEAALNRGLRKNSTSSIGWSLRFSWRAKAPSSSTATPNAPRMIPSVQPLWGASMMAQTRVTRPLIERRAPSGSSAGGFGSFEFGMIR